MSTTRARCCRSSRVRTSAPVFGKPRSATHRPHEQPHRRGAESRAASPSPAHRSAAHRGERGRGEGAGAGEARYRRLASAGSRHPAEAGASGRRPGRGRPASGRPGHLAETVAVPTGTTATDNAGIAARLEEFAAPLELSGAGYYSARAYRRAAGLVRAAPIEVAALVREGRVRDLRGIGSGIEARLEELIESGDIAELAELRHAKSLELAAFGRMLGIGARRATEIGAALGISTIPEFRQAAQQGRLTEVRGIGDKTAAKIVAALDQERTSRPVLLLPRARALTEEIATALGGVPAGDARRWMDVATRLAVVVT